MFPMKMKMGAKSKERRFTGRKVHDGLGDI